MNAMIHFFKRANAGRFLPVLWFSASLFIALLAGILLFYHTAIDGLSSLIITMGIDPLRAQFVAALIMSAGVAFVGATLGQRKLGAIVGAGLVFYFRYLADFIQLQLKPLYDAGGHLEALNPDALTHTSFMMIALALLGAFVGAAVGIAFAQVMLLPPYHLLRLIWQRYLLHHSPTPASINQTISASNSPSTLAITARWLGMVLLVILLIQAVGSSDLFFLSPDVGLHAPPSIGGVSQRVHGAIVQDAVVSAALGGQKRSFLVYLPYSYRTPQGQKKRYPTLYLLHGSPGQPKDWLNGGQASESADTLIATKQIAELILIIPDGSGRPGATAEWANSFDQRQRIETYVTSDLIPYVDKHYRTIPDAAHRGIAGLSMGGFGAMNIAVHHPDLFGSVISLGGYYQAEGSIWGHNSSYIQANSPLLTIQHTRAAWKLHIYLGAATRDQPYYKDTQQFIAVLNKLHIPYRFDLQNGYHSWRIWQIQIYHAYSWLQWG
jgi:enterochelin esterase-like enzyme